MGGDHRSRLNGHRELMLTLIAHQPDLTLAEIRTELAVRHGLAVGQTTIWRFFERHGITVKKVCTLPNRSSLTSPRRVEASWSGNRHRISST
jgi:transposase